MPGYDSNMATPLPLSETLRVALGVVMAAAGSNRHRLVHVEHGYYALLLEPDAASVITACGADLRDLERDLQLYFDPGDLRDYRGERSVPPMSTELAWAIRRARAHRRVILIRNPDAVAAVTGPDLLLALLQGDLGWGFPDIGRAVMDLMGFGKPAAGEVMSWHGVTLRSVRELLGRGARGVTPVAPPPRLMLVEGTHRVVVHDDSRTTMDFVVGVLEARFAYRTMGAVRLMLQAHTAGSAVVGIFDPKGAMERVEAALKDAEKAGHPLQLTVEPLAEAS